MSRNLTKHRNQTRPIRTQSVLYSSRLHPWHDPNNWYTNERHQVQIFRMSATQNFQSADGGLKGPYKGKRRSGSQDKSDSANYTMTNYQLKGILTQTYYKCTTARAKWSFSHLEWHSRRLRYQTDFKNFLLCKKTSRHFKLWNHKISI